MLEIKPIFNALLRSKVGAVLLLKKDEGLIVQ